MHSGGMYCNCFLNTLDKLLTNWVFLAIFIHPFLNEFEHQDFFFKEPVLKMGTTIIYIWALTFEIQF